MLKTDVAVSIGMLRSVTRWPSPDMPDWANTAARRMLASGVIHHRVGEIIEEMEKVRRAEFRKKIGVTQVTEFDEHLADLFNRFNT